MKYIFLLFFINYLFSADMEKIYTYEDGILRHYLIYVPDSYNNETKTKIVFESISQKNQKNYKSIITNFTIESSNGDIEKLYPELRVYNQPNIFTSEADIKTTLMSDKFIVINIVQNQDYFNVRYQIKPFMLWIWLSVLLISFGGLLSFLKKEYEK